MHVATWPRGLIHVAIWTRIIMGRDHVAACLKATWPKSTTWISARGHMATWVSARGHIVMWNLDTWPFVLHVSLCHVEFFFSPKINKL